MYDVAIIGARCAGSALALGLARAGLKTLVIDRTRFPSDTMSGHYLHPAGVSSIRRLGLLDRLEALGAPAQNTVTVDFGEVALTGTPAPAADGTTEGYSPRRYLFDAMLASAAVEAGAELWEGTSFVGALVEGGSTTGIRAVSGSGQSLEARARFIVGADGKRSRVAAAVGAETYEETPARTCTYYTYWEGLEVPHTHLFVREGRFFVATPTNDGLTFLAIAWPVSEFRRVRKDIAAAYHEAADEVPWLGERLRKAERAHRFIGTSDLGGFFRTPCGPGWALVGDAGYHKDPITAQGMTDALLDAECLAEALVDGLSGRRPLEEAMHHYGRRRDERARPMYALTDDLARLAPPTPEMAGLVAALLANPKETSRFLGIMAGTVTPAEFFAPESLAGIVGRPQAA